MLAPKGGLAAGTLGGFPGYAARRYPFNATFPDARRYLLPGFGTSILLNFKICAAKCRPCRDRIISEPGRLKMARRVIAHVLSDTC